MVILGFYGDNGKENGNYYNGFIGFRVIRGTILEVPMYNQDYSIFGSILGSLILGNYQA